MLSLTWFFPVIFGARQTEGSRVSPLWEHRVELGFSAQAGAGVDRACLLLSRRLRDGPEAVNKSTKLWEGKGIPGELAEMPLSMFS